MVASQDAEHCQTAEVGVPLSVGEGFDEVEHHEGPFAAPAGASASGTSTKKTAIRMVNLRILLLLLLGLVKACL